MTVVDTPGAQNPELSGQSRGATFEELCHNYAQERLQLLFHQRTFARELERYKEVTGTPPRAAITSSPLCMSISCPSPLVSCPMVALDQSSQSSSDDALCSRGNPGAPILTVPLLAAPAPSQQLCLTKCQAMAGVGGEDHCNCSIFAWQPRGTLPCVLVPPWHPALWSSGTTGNVLLPSYTPLRPIASPYHCLPTAWSLTEPLFPLTRRT